MLSINKQLDNLELISLSINRDVEHYQMLSRAHLRPGTDIFILALKAFSNTGTRLRFVSLEISNTKFLALEIILILFHFEITIFLSLEYAICVPGYIRPLLMFRVDCELYPYVYRDGMLCVI